MHKEAEILLVLDGGARFYIDTIAYDIKKGDIVFVAPYILHRSTIFADADFKHYCLCFDMELIGDNELKNGLEDGTVTIAPIITDGNNYGDFIKGAYHSHADSKPGWELKVIGNLSLFFGSLKENGLIRYPDIIVTKSICYHIVDYITKNYNQDITSSEAAINFHMSNGYFCRLFRKNFGYSFHNYLNSYRIEKSMLLLKNTDMSVSEISSAVGFNSFSYYSKTFKDYSSLTPSEYRQQKK